MAGTPTRTYAFCRDIMRRGGSTFRSAFLVLPAEQRAALEVVYAFFRVADDLIDRSPSPDGAALEAWRVEQHKALGQGMAEPQTALGRQLKEVARRYPLALEDFEQVLDGIASDIACPRYRHFDELRRYCEKVSGAVGLACLPIFGVAHENREARVYALELGTALQLTNILRDLGEDAARGQIYLPTEDLHRFGVDDAELKRTIPTPKLRALITFEVARARMLFQSARCRLGPEDRLRLLPVEVMADIYEALLGDIEREGGRHNGRPLRVRRRTKIFSLLAYLFERARA